MFSTVSAADATIERSAVKAWLFSSLIWLALGPALGAFQSLQFLAPGFMEFLASVGLAYSKVRIMHTNVVIYGWLGMSIVAAVLYIVPYLCKVRLPAPRVALAGAYLWNLAVLLDLALIWAGIPDNLLLSIQPYEYAEAPLLVDLLVIAGLVALIAIAHLAVKRRQRRGLYISIWYLLAGLWGTAIAYLVGNFLTYGFTGLGNQIVHAWWLHNVVGLFITPMGVGIAYYLIPKLTRAPLYSQRLGLIGFWTLYAFYPGTGLHHFLQMPMPTWINEFAVISSVLLAIPVLAVIYNHLATVQMKPHRLVDSLPLRFVGLATVLYLFTCIQGPIQATNAVNPFIHFTEWAQAHAHLALAGTFTSYSMAAVLYIFPRVTGRQLYSRALVSWVFWIMAFVFPLFFALFTISGLITGAGVNILGHTVYEMIPAVFLPRLARTISGVGLVAGWWLFAYVVFASLRRGPAFQEGQDEVAEAPLPLLRPEVAL